MPLILTCVAQRTSGDWQYYPAKVVYSVYIRSEVIWVGEYSSCHEQNKHYKIMEGGWHDLKHKVS